MLNKETHAHASRSSAISTVWLLRPVRLTDGQYFLASSAVRQIVTTDQGLLYTSTFSLLCTMLSTNCTLQEADLPLNTLLIMELPGQVINSI